MKTVPVLGWRFIWMGTALFPPFETLVSPACAFVALLSSFFLVPSSSLLGVRLSFRRFSDFCILIVVSNFLLPRRCRHDHRHAPALCDLVLDNLFTDDRMSIKHFWSLVSLASSLQNCGTQHLWVLSPAEKNSTVAAPLFLCCSCRVSAPPTGARSLPAISSPPRIGCVCLLLSMASPAIHDTSGRQQR